MKFSVAAIALTLGVAGVAGIVFAQTRADRPAPPQASGIQSSSHPDDSHPVLGKVLFEHVTSVHFCGVNMPANSDGSFGGWVGGDENGPAQMTIYENYIVREVALPNGGIYRESRPYDHLGNITQRIPAN